MTRQRTTPVLCQCIGCGCDDNNACQDLLGDPCGWAVKSMTGRIGVCTHCPVDLVRWKSKRRHFSERAKAAIAERRAMERAARRRRILHS